MDKNKLLIGFLTILVGILILLASDAFIKFTVIVLGALAVISGILNLVSARHQIIDPGYNRIILIRGILSIVIGLIAVTVPLAFAESLFNIMAYILGFYFFISALMQIYTSIRLYRNGVPVKQSIIEILTSLILSAFLFSLKFDTVKFIINICGFGLIAAGAIILFIQWRSKPLVITPDSVETVDSENTDTEDSKEKK